VPRVHRCRDCGTTSDSHRDGDRCSGCGQHRWKSNCLSCDQGLLMRESLLRIGCPNCLDAIEWPTTDQWLSRKASDQR